MRCEIACRKRTLRVLSSGAAKVFMQMGPKLPILPNTGGPWDFRKDNHNSQNIQFFHLQYFDIKANERLDISSNISSNSLVILWDAKNLSVKALSTWQGVSD